MSIWFLLFAVGIIGISGFPGLLLGRRSAAGQWIATVLNVIGSSIGGVCLIAGFWSGTWPEHFRRAWSLPIGQFAVGVDAMSALFLFPMLLISALGSVYGLEYWKQAEHAGNGRKLRLMWGLLTAAMMLVALARDAIVFLMAWEIMALAAYFLVTTEDRNPEVRKAGWVYLIAAHVGTLSLFALFGLLRTASGSFALWPAALNNVPGWLATAIFITGLVGFGLKAGIMPFHVWLPGAHANAPSHVSAILSGVLLKTGVYGVIRVASLLPHPPGWWGGVILAAGCVSGVLGIAFAVAQHDYKRLLAYSSIENVGIVMIGIGLALLGRSSGREDWVALGLGGALLHVLNHSLFKPLLFMGAGSILHATNTRRIDLLGGLAKQMPRTSRIFLLGAIAICGLPPLNGFVSEFLIYIGLFRTAADATSGSMVWAGMAAPVLAVIGALAVACFVKLVGAVFAGTPRSRCAEHAHDPGALMLGPMVALAVGCLVVGLAPVVLLGAVSRAIQAWNPAQATVRTPLPALPPLTWISAGGFLVIIASALGLLALRRLRRRGSRTSVGTWDCGYIKSSPRIQYSGSSFAQMLTGLFGWILIPRRLAGTLGGLFARPTKFRTEVPDTVLDRALIPAFSFVERVLAFARPMQRGAVQVYLLYVLGVLLALLLFAWW